MHRYLKLGFQGDLALATQVAPRAANGAAAAAGNGTFDVAAEQARIEAYLASMDGPAPQQLSQQLSSAASEVQLAGDGREQPGPQSVQGVQALQDLAAPAEAEDLQGLQQDESSEQSESTGQLPSNGQVLRRRPGVRLRTTRHLSRRQPQ